MGDIERIRSALKFVPADERETWIRMGMAAKSELGDSGFDLWDEWSQTSDAYKASDARAAWRSFKPGGGIGLGTLFHEAKTNGWQDSRTNERPSDAERAERLRKAEERKREAQARAASEQEAIDRARMAAASKASAIMYAAVQAQDDNPYLTRKGVSAVATLREIDAEEAYGILAYRPKSGSEHLTGRLLVTPIKQGDTLSNVELADGDGRKTALPGRGTKAGGYWATESLPDGDGQGTTLLIGEGVATVMSASEATGHPAIAALSSGNLVAVAKAMRERFPAADLVILADLGKADGRADRHAIEAARAVDGKLAVPVFGADRTPGMTDFNDMAAAVGKEAVANAILNAVAKSRASTPNASTGAVSLYNAEGKPLSQTDILIDIGSRHRLFHNERGEAYVGVKANVREAILRVDSADYRKALGGEFFKITEKGASGSTIGDAVNTLEWMAIDGAEERVNMRTADTTDGIAIDLSDDTGEAVTITAKGWEITPAPVNFLRVGKQLPLPRPQDPDFQLLWEHVNVNEEDRVLVAAWMLAALRPRGPYPIMLLVGEQGSGKSSTSRTLKRLTDPSASLLRAPPKDTRDLLVGAHNAWVLSLDNLSGSSAELSDALCRISTGGAIAERRLYTNDEEILIEIQRPMILNGIEDPATRPDLADRCIHLSLPQLQTPRSEAEIERVFQQDAPAIFAALLDGLALAIRDHGSVRIGKLPRMADFAMWAAAGVPALGYSPEQFMDAYQRNRADMMDIAVEASPVASALARLMDGCSKWEGSSAELLLDLARLSHEASNSPAWPRSQKGMLGVLDRLAPALRGQGIEIFRHKLRHRNLIEVRKR